MKKRGEVAIIPLQPGDGYIYPLHPRVAKTPWRKRKGIHVHAWLEFSPASKKKKKKKSPPGFQCHGPGKEQPPKTLQPWGQLPLCSPRWNAHPTQELNLMMSTEKTPPHPFQILLPESKSCSSNPKSLFLNPKPPQTFACKLVERSQERMGGFRGEKQMDLALGRVRGAGRRILRKASKLNSA